MQHELPPDPLPVATMLTPTERLRVDAAGQGSYLTYHRDTLDEVVQDLKSNRVSAVLVSVTRCDSHARAGVAALVREWGVDANGEGKTVWFTLDRASGQRPGS